MNLTPGGPLQDWSDGEILCTLREGVDRDGRPLVFMGAVRARYMSDEDLPAVHIVDLGCALWSAIGIFQLAVVWFGLRQGQAWAFWVIVAADIAHLVGWIAYGVQSRDSYAPLFSYDAIFLIPAALLGWIGLR